MQPPKPKLTRRYALGLGSMTLLSMSELLAAPNRRWARGVTSSRTHAA